METRSFSVGMFCEYILMLGDIKMGVDVEYHMSLYQIV